MVRGCGECHTQASFDAMHAVGHEEHLPLVGGHRGLDCRTCHTEGEEHSLERLARGLRGLEARDCASCHETPHANRFLNRVARVLEVTAGATCASCHVEEHTSFTGDGAPEALDETTAARLGGMAPRLLASQVTPRLHRASGFALVAPHDEVSCEACHDPGLGDFAARHPGRDESACSVCHDDPHGGQFRRGRFAGQECTACHAREAFAPHTFDLEAHAETAFALEDSHATTDCAECHVEPPGRPRIFRGTPGTCEQCHEDAHQGSFDEPLAALEAPRAQGTCSECHLATSFADVPRGDLGQQHDPGRGPEEAFAGRPFVHERWTGLPLRGAHVQTDCETCHPRSELSDDHGRRFGRVEEHFGAVDGCTTCHQDPHEGGFDVRAVPRRHKGETGCLRCHVESSFRALPHGFDHELWTDFELDGAHETADCSACHTPLERPDELGRTWARAAGDDCGACHAEPHAGQFDVAGVTDCSRCHHSAEGWDVLRFDHDHHSRFPLGESHAQVACNSCHIAWELEDGMKIVRYRPLDVDCASCHGSQEGPRLRRRSRKGDR